MKPQPVKSSKSKNGQSYAAMNSAAYKLATIYYTPKSKIVFLRVFMICSLLIAAAIVGWANYTTLTNNEREFGVSQYKSIAVQALSIMVGSFSRMNKGTLVMAKAYGYALPREDMWPNVALAGFYDMAADLGAVSALDNVIFGPVIQRADRNTFVSFAQAYWNSEPNIPPPIYAPDGVTIMGPPGRIPFVGIWKTNALGQPEPDITGEVFAYPSPHNDFFSVPMQMTFSPDLSAFMLGYNGHSDPLFGPPQDVMLDCVAGATDLQFARTQCGFFSNTIPLPVPTPDNPFPATTNMQAFIFQPIVIASNGTGTPIVVGSLCGAVNWKTLLSRAVPSYVSGLDCVVTTTGGAFTYAMEDGEPVFKGPGDLHDDEFSKYAETIDLLSESDVGSFTSYHLTFYPRRQFFRTYETNAPFWTTFGAIAIILFCMLVFFVYDFTINRESSRKELILDTKRRFVRFISHEIRTPLNTVRLGLKLLEMEMESMYKQAPATPPLTLVALVRDTISSWMQLTDDILGNSDSAVDVLNDLLNYDKIESGTLRLEFSSVAIWNLVKKTAAAFVMQAKQKEVVLEVTGECWSVDLSEEDADLFDQLRVVGDCTRIAQVLRNLLSNALKFTPEHGKVIVNAEWVPYGLPDAIIVVPLEQTELLEEPRAGSIRVSVTDSGAGLSPEQLAAICSEGVQFNANQLQAGGGSGLGLYISKGLAEQHGGKLTVSSEGLGKGSTFTLEMPLFKYEQDMTLYGSLRSKPNGGVSSRKSSSAGSARKGSKLPSASEFADDVSLKSIIEGEDTAPVANRQRRILVVDDAMSNRKLLMRILVAKGYICDGAEDGQQAVDIYTELRDKGEIVDAVLMDYEMPVMDGPTAVKAIRDLGCSCFMVGVTGNVLPADVAHFKKQGANAVLAKPLNIDIFESMFRGFKPATVATAVHDMNSLAMSTSGSAMMEKEKKSPTPDYSAAGNKVHPMEIV